MDKELDETQRKLGENDEDLVMDSRLGFYFIPNSYKIFLKVDLNEGAKRIFNDIRDEERYSDLEECKKHLQRRIESEKIRYKQYYDINFPDESKFDLIINTNDISAKEVVDKIVGVVEKIKSPEN
jgi:cytidylate kinase